MNENNTADDLFRERSPKVVNLDNLIRRKLRVSDPTDPKEIAAALRKLYKKESEALERETVGLPHLLAPLPVAAVPVVTSSQAEVDQAVGDIERDLKTLTTNSLLKDIEPELQGWATAIRAATADGLNHARLSMDSQQRELAFANRRILGDYARIARYAGALIPNMNTYFRRLAQSLDEVAGVMLVLMGEALANIGFAGGRFLLQVPLTEMQARRDAVLYALRNLVGSTQEAFSPREWPYGLVSYSQLLERLDTSGQADLKALLQENHLARLMDDLIHRAAGGSAAGLRALGATYQPVLQSFRRLLLAGKYAADPESPPLTSFFAALQHFLSAFENASTGFRLLFISRPPIVFYGLYGISGPDAITTTLLKLIEHRNQLANHLDCFLGCECESAVVTCQILLDKVLHDLDRIIDLYILSPDDKEEGLQRAAAFWVLIDQVLNLDDSTEPCYQRVNNTALKKILDEIKSKLDIGTFSFPNAPNTNYLIDSISIKNDTTGIDVKFNDLSGNGYSHISELQNIPLKDLGKKLDNIFREMNGVANALDITLDKAIEEYLGAEVANKLEYLADMSSVMLEEFCMQQTAEEKWKSLLRSMTPSCLRSEELLNQTTNILQAAMEVVAGPGVRCPDLTVNPPPTLETSSAGRTYGRWSNGWYA